MSVSIDTRRLERRLGVAPAKIKRVVRNAMNDAARELRRETPSIIDQAVDKPVPFTRRASAVLYRGATYQSLSASLQIAPLQSAYLSPAELGQTSEQIQTPIRRDAIDQRGNLKKRFRWSPAERAKLAAQVHRVKGKRGGTRTIGKYFSGKPLGGRYRHAGLFFRPKDPKKPLQRITSYTPRRRYPETFGIRRRWMEKGKPLLDRHLRAQARHPSNRL